VLFWWQKEIEQMLKQLNPLSTAGQLLLINVKMLLVDLDVFNADIVGRLDTYIDLQTTLLKQARSDTVYLARSANLPEGLYIFV